MLRTEPSGLLVKSAFSSAKSYLYSVLHVPNQIRDRSELQVWQPEVMAANGH